MGGIRLHCVASGILASYHQGQWCNDVQVVKWDERLIHVMTSFCMHVYGAFACKCIICAIRGLFVDLDISSILWLIVFLTPSNAPFLLWRMLIQNFMVGQEGCAELCLIFTGIGLAIVIVFCCAQSIHLCMYDIWCIDPWKKCLLASGAPAQRLGMNNTHYSYSAIPCYTSAPAMSNVWYGLCRRQTHKKSFCRNWHVPSLPMGLTFLSATSAAHQQTLYSDARCGLSSQHPHTWEQSSANFNMCKAFSPKMNEQQKMKNQNGWCWWVSAIPQCWAYLQW